MKGVPHSGRHQVNEKDRILLVDGERVEKSKSGISVWKKAKEGLQDASVITMKKWMNLGGNVLVL